jgi:hypothetical protein
MTSESAARLDTLVDHASDMPMTAMEDDRRRADIKNPPSKIENAPRISQSTPLVATAVELRYHPKRNGNGVFLVKSRFQGRAKSDFHTAEVTDSSSVSPIEKPRDFAGFFVAPRGVALGRPWRGLRACDATGWGAVGFVPSIKHPFHLAIVHSADRNDARNACSDLACCQAWVNPGWSMRAFRTARRRRWSSLSPSGLTKNKAA